MILADLMLNVTLPVIELCVAASVVTEETLTPDVASLVVEAATIAPQIAHVSILSALTHVFTPAITVNLVHHVLPVSLRIILQFAAAHLAMRVIHTLEQVADQNQNQSAQLMLIVLRRLHVWEANALTHVLN
jgi:hypothetical protein